MRGHVDRRYAAKDDEGRLKIHEWRQRADWPPVLRRENQGQSPGAALIHRVRVNRHWASAGFFESWESLLSLWRFGVLKKLDVLYEKGYNLDIKDGNAAGRRLSENETDGHPLKEYLPGVPALHRTARSMARKMASTKT